MRLAKIAGHIRGIIPVGFQGVLEVCWKRCGSVKGKFCRMSGSYVFIVRCGFRKRIVNTATMGTAVCGMGGEVWFDD